MGDPITDAVTKILTESGLKMAFNGMMGSPEYNFEQQQIGNKSLMPQAGTFGNPFETGTSMPGVSQFKPDAPINAPPGQRQPQQQGSTLGGLAMTAAPYAGKYAWNKMFGANPTNWVGGNPANWTSAIGAWDAPAIGAATFGAPAAFGAEALGAGALGAEAAGTAAAIGAPVAEAIGAGIESAPWWLALLAL